MNDPWLLGLLGGLILLWGGSLFIVRHWTKRRLLRTWAQENYEQKELYLFSHERRPEDKEALELIRSYRRRFLLKLWPDTRFSLKRVNDLVLPLISEIAAIYYPDEERPELKASLTDLIALYNRVGNRLRNLLETLPLRPIKDVELQTVLRYHELYQKVISHPGYQFMKQHHLDKIARWAWTAYNYASPWYWGRRMAYAGSREVLSRLFLARLSAIVGEEAIRLYSRRSPNSADFGCYRMALQEMINLSWSDKKIPANLLNYIMRFILEARGLLDQEKIVLLRRLLKPRISPLHDVANLEAMDRDRIYRWLKQMVSANWAEGERQIKVEQLQKIWQ